ncbi:hypothetical protein E2562_008347 [Oryza meyeriana var. granulata]|uniref:Uncharacterized protein n=1 Tax=Oryza meyeriana var. granulata TaxID=110450 RepID=A0A6G1EGY8_9ORYZ|nr:hypothetical protein E2562_008347 [Oryza meyeriana var. granulata]
MILARAQGPTFSCIVGDDGCTHPVSVPHAFRHAHARCFGSYDGSWLFLAVDGGQAKCGRRSDPNITSPACICRRPHRGDRQRRGEGAHRGRAVPLSCAAYSVAASSGGDIEDSFPPLPTPRGSLLARFRERRPLFVTDITATEWCEKQMEFVPKHGKPERTQAMKAGSERHAQLEQETLEDVLNYFKVTCHMLSRSQEQLLLRYELQADHSLLEEYQFSYDARWFKDQTQEVLSF